MTGEMASPDCPVRAEDQTVVGYAIGWGTTLSKPPYVADMTYGDTYGDWGQIFELEKAWKQQNGFA
jgi:branched-chain amino acid transport system substrate-binding protein